MDEAATDQAKWLEEMEAERLQLQLQLILSRRGTGEKVTPLPRAIPEEKWWLKKEGLDQSLITEEEKILLEKALDRARETVKASTIAHTIPILPGTCPVEDIIITGEAGHLIRRTKEGNLCSHCGARIHLSKHPVLPEVRVMKHDRVPEKASGQVKVASATTTSVQAEEAKVKAEAIVAARKLREEARKAYDEAWDHLKEQRRKNALHREALIAQRRKLDEENRILSEEARIRALHAETGAEQMRTLWARAHSRAVRRATQEAKLAFRLARIPVINRGLLLSFSK